MLQQMVKGMPVRPVQAGRALWSIVVKISVAVRHKSLGACFNVFFQGWTNPVPETLCFYFYVNHERMGEVQNIVESER